MFSYKDEEFEIGLKNFCDENKSLWTKTVGICRNCSGAVWILTRQFREKGRYPEDMYAACESCRTAGTLDGILPFDPNVMHEPPAESCP